MNSALDYNYLSVITTKINSLLHTFVIKIAIKQNENEGKRTYRLLYFFYTTERNGFSYLMLADDYLFNLFCFC